MTIISYGLRPMSGAQGVCMVINEDIRLEINGILVGDRDGDERALHHSTVFSHSFSSS